MKNSTISTLALALLSAPVLAKPIWSDFSLTYLNGKNYQVGDDDRQVFTFEHAAGMTWGDSFFFVDRLESANGDKTTYTEWSPRLKLIDFDKAPVSNLYLASTFEVGDGFTNTLFGVGTDIPFDAFKFFKVNLYHKQFENSDNAYQTTISWGVDIGPLYYDGFLDHVFSQGNTNSQTNLTSQLKYDVAPHLLIKEKFFVGVEYVYWRDKFGIQDVNESNVNLLLKYHF